jgi:hypothetical protein
MAEVRSACELAEVSDPAWPAVLSSFEAAGKRVRVLPVDHRRGLTTLHRLQVTARSALGALALNSGGVLVDHGWLRLLGGGYEGLPDLATANQLTEPSERSTPPGSLVVGHDVLGGRFAIDGGALGTTPGHVGYFAPDTLRWEPLGIGHGAFVAWACTPAVSDFYRGFRWDGWKHDVVRLSLDAGFAVYPPLFTTQGKGSTQRASVPIEELFAFHEDMARQLRELPEGAPFELRADP